MAETQQAAAPEKVKLTVSQILEDLNQGLDRKAIRAKYGLSANDVTKLFQHDKLKGTRVKKAPAFELEDDTPELLPVKKKAPAASKAAVVEETVSAAPVTAEAAANTEAPVDTVEEGVTEQNEVEVAPGPGIQEVVTEADKTTEKGLW